MSVSRLKTKGDVPEAVFGHTLNYIPETNHMFYLGGTNSKKQSVASCKQIEIGKFIWIPLKFFPFPLKIHCHTCTYYKNLCFYIYGGNEPFKNEHLGYVYRLKIVQNKAQIEKIEVKGNVPNRRKFHTCVIVDINNEPCLVMIGGRKLSQNTILSDVWTFNLVKKTWRKIGDIEPRSGHSCIYCEKTKKIVVFGGMNGKHELVNDIIEIDVFNNKWRKIIPTGTKPPERELFGYDVVDGDKLAVFGGKTKNGPSADAYVMDLTNYNWFILSKKLGPLRFHHTCLYNDQILYSFGGQTESGKASVDFLKIRFGSLVEKFFKKTGPVKFNVQWIELQKNVVSSKKMQPIIRMKTPTQDVRKVRSPRSISKNVKKPQRSIEKPLQQKVIRKPQPQVIHQRQPQVRKQPKIIQPKIIQPKIIQPQVIHQKVQPKNVVRRVEPKIIMPKMIVKKKRKKIPIVIEEEIEPPQIVRGRRRKCRSTTWNGVKKSFYLDYIKKKGHLLKRSRSITVHQIKSKIPSYYLDYKKKKGEETSSNIMAGDVDESLSTNSILSGMRRKSMAYKIIANLKVKTVRESAQNDTSLYVGFAEKFVNELKKNILPPPKMLMWYQRMAENPEFQKQLAEMDSDEEEEIMVKHMQDPDKFVKKKFAIEKVGLVEKRLNLKRNLTTQPLTFNQRPKRKKRRKRGTRRQLNFGEIQH